MTVPQQQAAGAGPGEAGAPPPRVRVGVLALQGSFREHMALLSRVEGVEAVEVRTKEELSGLAGLVIPGGESTTMAHIAEHWGLIPELQAFAKAGRPIWGTCAGMIFLAERAEGAQWGVGGGDGWRGEEGTGRGGRAAPGRTHAARSRAAPNAPPHDPARRLPAPPGQKKGGQALLGGLDVCVSRNFFGAQVHSFEAALPAPPPLRALGGADTFRAVFIRAPAVLEAGPAVEVLAEYTLTPEEAAKAGGRGSVVVAVKQGQLLATAFHPELTSDARW
jgi:5'-phosphate synthase pdxT subunit